MPLDDYLARKDWIAPRQDRWSDILPESWQTAINTSPTLNALARYMSRPSFEEGVKQWQDSIPGNSPIDRIADKKSTLAQEFPSPMNPLGQSLMETGGFLANFIGPGAKLPPAAAPKPQGIRAYHGSPHDFDRFDISKIGTGEGAQAYGRGLYFAESEDIAKYYRNQLTGNTPLRYDGVPASHRWDTADLTWLDHKILREKGPSEAIEQAVTRLRQRAADDAAQALREGRDVDSFNMYAAAADRLSKLDPSKVSAPGRMYEVRINADPETFLDWDKPLSQMGDVGKKLAGLAYPNAPFQSVDHLKIQSVIDALHHRPTPHARSPQQVTDMLRDAGIPGIKYKDQMSRGTDGGTSNFVVFDAALIEILRKYGLLPPVAAGAAQSLSQGQDTAY